MSPSYDGHSPKSVILMTVFMEIVLVYTFDIQSTHSFFGIIMIATALNS